MLNYDQETQEVGIPEQEQNCETSGSSRSGLMGRKGETQTTQSPKMILPTYSQHVRKKREKNSSKLIISAEVTKPIWDSAQDAIERGKYKNVSDLVRRAVTRELGKPIRLR